MNPDVTLIFNGGYLRPLTAADVYEGYVSGLNDPAVNRYLDHVKYTRQTRQSVCDFIDANVASDDAVLWGIWQEGAPHPCGTVRLHGIEYRHGTAHIGICIFDKRVWGQRLGSKAIAKVTRWALDVLHLRWVEAGAYAANIASQKAFLVAGYEWVFDIPGKYVLEGEPTTVKVFAARPMPK